MLPTVAEQAHMSWRARDRACRLVNAHVAEVRAHNARANIGVFDGEAIRQMARELLAAMPADPLASEHRAAVTHA